MWAHKHPLFLPEPRPPRPGHLTTLSVFCCPSTHLPTYLPKYLPSDRPSLRPSSLLPSLATLSLVFLFLPPLANSPSMSVMPAFILFYFSTNCASALPWLARISTSRRISPHFFPFFPFFISDSVSRFSNLVRCPPSSSNQSHCRWAVILSVRVLQLPEVSGS